ncbi:copper resistance CopC family protein [Georgenia muralis]
MSLSAVRPRIGRTRRTGGTRPARVRTALVTLVSLVGTVLVLALGSAPAAAHDYLVSTSPEADATVDVPPTSVDLTFNRSLLGVAPAMIVTDPAGETLVEGTPEIRDAVASMPMPSSMAEGTYRVAWSVVSSDGHRIQGAFAFSVGTPSLSSTDAAGPEGADDDPAAAVAEPGREQTDGGFPVWAAGLLGGLALLGVLAIVVVGRLRSRAATEATTPPGPAPAATTARTTTSPQGES